MTFHIVADTLRLRELDRLDREHAAEIGAEHPMTLLDGSPLPEVRPEAYELISSTFVGGGWYAAIRRGPHPPRRVRGVAGFLVDLALDSARHRPV
ncbi:hypothetical protein ABIQ69_00325 [Agromyces sp. G08B096]|uniref:GNAT family N-acetyltransferase n=1 Tax=Agromyces sp. G08B096 TaxID=3156399 RepID=A0AAU7WCN4_9MICO